MPVGMPYFAWIDASETTFSDEHLRWDEKIFSCNLAQEEGDPASLTVVVRRPRNEAGNPIGLLGPGRKIWCWFALDCGPDLIKFRGRLVGVPTSLFEELVTLEFVARPADIVTQKAALADSLRVLPYYDEVVIDPAQRTDPENVLEGYTKIWHYDRETHELTVSDEIDGEDGLVEFDGASTGGRVMYEGLGLSLTSGPLTRVDIRAEYTWTQQATGNVDLTNYLITNWWLQDGGVAKNPGFITSYSFKADNWPKPGAGIGDGWAASQGTTAQELEDTTVSSRTTGFKITVKFPDSSWFGPSTTTTSVTDTRSGVSAIGIGFAGIITQDDYSAKYGGLTDSGSASLTRSFSESGAFLPLCVSKVTLIAGYTANRQCTEVVTFSLFADVQHALTEPEDGEALTVNDIRSVNLSESIGDGTDAYIPIGDKARRSYIATARGNQSIEHLIALARAHLLHRSRVVEITFTPPLSRMPEITLRKNVYIAEPRIGEALGKIIGYSVGLSGSDGKVTCQIKIGCAIGRGGTAVAAGGEPMYCSADYVGPDYQQYTGRIVLFDTSVGYEPPLSNPNDDGLEFLSTLRAEDVIDVGLVVTNPASVQGPVLVGLRTPVSGLPSGPTSDAQQARSQQVSNTLKQFETKATFKLKPMSREFSSDYEIQVTDLKVPTGYDLEAV